MEKRLAGRRENPLGINGNHFLMTLQFSFITGMKNQHFFLLAASKHGRCNDLFRLQGGSCLYWPCYFLKFTWKSICYRRWAINWNYLHKIILKFCKQKFPDFLRGMNSLMCCNIIRSHWGLTCQDSNFRKHLIESCRCTGNECMSRNKRCRRSKAHQSSNLPQNCT